MILYTVYVTNLGFMDVYVHAMCTQIHSDWYNWKENCYCSFIRMQHDQNIWCELYVVDCFTVYRKSSSLWGLTTTKILCLLKECISPTWSYKMIPASDELVH